MLSLYDFEIKLTKLAIVYTKRIYFHDTMCMRVKGLCDLIGEYSRETATRLDLDNLYNIFVYIFTTFHIGLCSCDLESLPIELDCDDFRKQACIIHKYSIGLGYTAYDERYYINWGTFYKFIEYYSSIL